MANQKNNYQFMEFIYTVALIAAVVLYVIYLIAAGCGIIWLKVLTAVVAILASGGALVLLYLSGELLKQRSLWLSAGFAAVVLCLLVSLILNYPSPNPMKEKDHSGVNVPAVGVMMISDN